MPSTRSPLIVQADESSKLTVRTLVLPEWAAELLEQRYAAETCPATPVFAAPKGGLRDPSNTQADLRAAFSDCSYAWVTSLADVLALAQLSRIQIRYRRWFPCLFAKMTVSGMLGRLSSRSARSRHAFS